MPTFPSTAAFPASASFPAAATFPFGGLTLTNAQKLSLPANTPVGTEVMVSDWVAAGLTGPHQRLKAPSAAQGGVFVSGGTQDGVYSKRGTGPIKEEYNLLGQDYNDPFGFRWRELPIEGAPLAWIMQDAGGEPLYYSLSNVATPDLASNWKNASDDSPASITVTSVTQGELDAGVTVAGAGTTSVNGVWLAQPVTFETANGNRVFTLLPTLDSDFLQVGGAGWAVDVGDGGYRSSKTAHPWSAAWSVVDGTPPAPTLTRNDVASEQNWEVIP